MSHRHATRTLLLLAGLMLASGTACGGGDDDPVPDAAPIDEDAVVGDDVDTVTIDTFQFEPDEVVVEVGDTVTWINEDDVDHTVTQGTRGSPAEGGFDGAVAAGSTFVATFEAAGTFDYFCRIHDGMSGTVVVE